MLHLVSYSYFPDNVPAAHRPYQLASYLDRRGVPVTVHSRYGRHAPRKVMSNGSGLGAAVDRGSRLKRGAFTLIGILLGWFLQVDKALPWALRAFPGILLLLLNERVRTGRRPTVWATCPLASNIYLAGVVASLVGADLHLDLRDAIDGINSKRAPWLTRFVIKRARSLTVVTGTLARYASESGFCPPAMIVFNGVSQESLTYSEPGVGPNSDWVEVCYTGAMYGGDRPYVTAISILSVLARRMPREVRGIRLTIAGREDLSSLPGQYSHERFEIIIVGEVTKQDALVMTGASEINLILVGSGGVHRCAIPLKAFDLLGAGRPILYFGPKDADAALFLEQFASDLFFFVDSEKPIEADLDSLRCWLLNVRRNQSSPRGEPSSESQSARIAQLLGVP